MPRFIRFVAVAALTLGLMLALAAPAAANVREWHRHYYDNYFKSFLTCVSRGEGAIGHRNADQRIAYAISYVCYKAPRQTRYSMDILFEYPGGGGGSGSWTFPMR